MFLTTAIYCSQHYTVDTVGTICKVDCNSTQIISWPSFNRRCFCGECTLVCNVTPQCNNRHGFLCICEQAARVEETHQINLNGFVYDGHDVDINFLRLRFFTYVTLWVRLDCFPFGNPRRFWLCMQGFVFSSLTRNCELPAAQSWAQKHWWRPQRSVFIFWTIKKF